MAKIKNLKFTIEEVTKQVKKMGGILISNEYIDGQTPLKFICVKCGKEYERSFNNTRKTDNVICRNCGGHNRIENSKHTYDYVYDFIKNTSNTLLSLTYNKESEKLKILCNCGETYYVNFVNFKGLKHKVCEKCLSKITSKIYRPDIGIIKKYVEDNNCEWISGEYINRNSILVFKCFCGEIFSRRYDSFKAQKKICPNCAKKNQGKLLRYTIDDIKKIIKDKTDCEVLENDYVNARSKMNIKCTCGNIFEATLDGFLRKNTKKCPVCTMAINESIGETLVRDILDKNNIKYEREKSFDDLKYKVYLRYDFYLPEKNIIIEVNGIQHRIMVKLFGGEEEFKLSKIRYDIKLKFAKDNNITLLEIPTDRWNDNIKQEFIEKWEKEILRLVENGT